MNTAVLTGRQVSQGMKVFIVSQAGTVADVTLQSSCHSEDESVLKVLFLDSYRVFARAVPRACTSTLLFRCVASDKRSGGRANRVLERDSARRELYRHFLY